MLNKVMDPYGLGSLQGQGIHQSINYMWSMALINLAMLLLIQQKNQNFISSLKTLK